ncbi:MAG TPA: hypothetical protein VGG72_08160 [Bryobacteraceae bacterium]
MTMQGKDPVAALTAIALAVVSIACVLSCWSPQPAMPLPCHHHAKSCAPLLLTAEAPHSSLASAVVPAFSISTALGGPVPAPEALAFAEPSPDPVTSPPTLGPPAQTILRI